MTIEFQYTLDDYKEANRGHAASRVGARWIWVWIIVFVVIVGALVLLSQPTSSVTTTRPVANLVGALAPMAPWLLILPVLAIALRTRTAKPRKRFIDVSDRKSKWHAHAGWLLVAVVTAGFIAMGILGDRAPDPATPRTAGDWINNWWPLILFGILFCFIWIVLVRGAFKRNWRLQPALLRHKTFEYSPEKITISDELTSMSYRWLAIVRCIETPNLFCVYVSEISFHMVPKRSFPSTDAADGFRRLVLEWAGGHSLGFPVIQNAEDVGMPTATSALK